MNKIICGDCIEILKTMPNDSIDFIFFSPPYNNIRDYNNNWSLNLHSLGIELFRVLKNNRACAMVIQDQTEKCRKSLSAFRTIVDWCDIGFGLWECAIYARTGRPGNWWTYRFRVDHEYIPIFIKGKKLDFFDKSHLTTKVNKWKATGTTRHTNGQLKHDMSQQVGNTKSAGTVFYYKNSSREGDGLGTKESHKMKLKHPATFPDQLAYDLILCFSQKNEIILDPLCGAGTTCCMAKKAGRQYIGIDINKEYCDLAEKRLGL